MAHSFFARMRSGLWRFLAFDIYFCMLLKQIRTTLPTLEHVLYMLAFLNFAQ